jgi:hypothetical protein
VLARLDGERAPYGALDGEAHDGLVDRADLFDVKRSPHRLLHMSLAPEIPNLSAAHQRFVAGRSMRYVEPSVAFNPRDPKGEKIANADDLA